MARPPGHHATAARGQGFCLFNNVAVAAAALVARGERVLIVDWDVHHGNGTQEIFWDDPSVLYVSTHQSPAYPGTGRVEETGGAHAAGLTVNFPLPPGATGDVAMSAMDDVVAPLVDAFSPTWVLISAGFDAHRSDPLADLEWSAGDYRSLAARVLGFAPAAGRTVAFLEGGYDLPALRASTAATTRALVGETTRADEPPTSGGPGGQVVARAAACSWSEPVEDRDDLVVGRGTEVAVPLTDRRERLWRRDAHDLVGDGRQFCDGRQGCHRDRDDDQGGALFPGHADRGSRGASRRQSVVDEDDGATGDGDACVGRRATGSNVASSSLRSRRSTCSSCSSVMRSASITSRFSTRTPPSPIAPIASSGCLGTPSLRTMMTSSGACRVRATTAATGTPPRAARRPRDCSWRGRTTARAGRGERTPGGVPVGERDAGIGVVRQGDSLAGRRPVHHDRWAPTDQLSATSDAWWPRVSRLRTRRRETCIWLIPIRSAISDCVRPSKNRR